MFEHNSINLDLLRQRAFNLRWATVPEGVIPLTAADPDFPCAPQIAEAINSYVSGRYLCYGPPTGLPLFKNAMAQWFREKRSIPADPDLLFPVDSAASGIYITCRAFLQPGDEAIIFDPVDFLFRYSVEAVGAAAVPFAIPQGEPSVDFDGLEKLITAKTRMLCICNPLNPTGKVFTKAELKQFAAIAHKHDLVILSDEIWSDIVYAPHTYTSIASLDEETHKRTITVTGFSKSYGLAGLRIGTLEAGTKAYFDRLLDASLHTSTIHGANTIGQVAAATALTQCQDWLQQFVAHLTRMRDLCVAGLNDLEGVRCKAPEGCYVAFADITGTGRTSKEIADFFMLEKKVAVVPGLRQWFGDGAEGYIRLSFATSEAILGDALSRLKK
ncbi:MAG: pyridoxal phosphate-dependent aminotransferase [Taibaiella sp.]|nr:pyridoxal phosphate-dependent aminotransferase [Taibaiella sp.]